MLGNVIRVIIPTLILRIIFVLSVVHVMRVMHVTRVMRPTPFSHIILFRVMRVMHVIRAMTPTPLSPRIFGIRFMGVTCVVHV